MLDRALYRVPNTHTLHTIHDTNTLDVGTFEVIANVTTAGNLALRMRGDAAAVAYTLPVGWHVIRGEFDLVASTGTTAVLSPASKVIVHGRTVR